ncbi:protein FAM171A2 [Danio rerio]|uniref:Family with sequence similarity 171 member A2b n=1 Tax=Danio rerio TaxID=7955 RepID=E7F922_DANRE|nr:protein FAM171A2-like [Danio rerio]|eukprot:XP_001337555.2 protein FAM171A2-like [Danio rerio]
MPSFLVSRFLFFLILSVFKGTAGKSLPEREAVEVQVRVQVFDGGDLSPLPNAALAVHGNQSLLAQSRAGSDGVQVVSFTYRTGTWVIITASQRDYLTSSVPWHASRLPLYASVSLYLMAQKPGTLILYDDVIQVFHGSPSGRSQPWLQVPRRSLQFNSSYTELTAVLTTAREQNEINSFPYPLALEPNNTGGENGWTDLTTIAAVSAQLFDREGRAVEVSEPVHISVPLPSDTHIRSASSIPVWMYDTKTGLWVRNGTGFIIREGSQLRWDFTASQLGYWIAAFRASSGSGLSHPGLRDITAYHTFFLLSILGSLALLVLVLLCVLLYYCRRRCLKPRRQQKQVQVPSALNGSRKDQGTSTSHLNLICGGHVESAASNGNLDANKSEGSPSHAFKSARDEFTRHIPAHKLRHSSKNKQSKGAQRNPESFPMKVHQSTDTSNLDSNLLHENYGRNYSSDDKDQDYRRRHVVNDNRGYTSDPPSPPLVDKPPEYSQVLQGPDHLARPTSLNTQPGQIIFCSSLDQMKENMYRTMVPTLVIPAHYMRFSSEFGGSDQGKDGTNQSDRDGQSSQGTSSGIQSQIHQGQTPGSGHTDGQQGASPAGSDDSVWPSSGTPAPVHIPVLFNDSTISQMNGELQALTEKKLLELGVKQHPRAWFISLDGRANAHVRHSYIDVGADHGHSGTHSGNHSAQSTLSAPAGSSKDRSIDASLQDTQHDRKSASGRKTKEEHHGSSRKGHGGSSFGGGKHYSKPAYHDPLDLSGGVSRMGASSPLENPLTPLLDDGPEEPRGSSMPRRGRSRGNSSRSSNSETQRDSVTSPEDDNDLDDKEENKKSPWQRIEERPLMVFHPKK